MPGLGALLTGLSADSAARSLRKSRKDTEYMVQLAEYQAVALYGIWKLLVEIHQQGISQ